MVKVTQKSLKLIAVSKESSLDIFKKKKRNYPPPNLHVGISERDLGA